MLSPVHKKWRLFRTWSGRYPVWCAWQVTYRCNFRCGFCAYWKDPAGRLPEQTLERIRQGSRKLAGMGTLMISIGGGEPTLRGDLPEVVAAMAEYHFPFLTTNGYNVTPRLASDLFEAGLWGASISLDHADPAVHDRRRGKKNAFERAVRALDCFAAARRYAWQRVNLMCVLMHDNLDDIERLIQLAAAHDAYFMVQPYCTRKTGSETFVCRPGDIGRRLVDLRRRYANFLSNPVFLGRFDEAIERGVGGCKAGLAFFNIDSTGDVAICVERRRSPVGNLYELPIQTIVQRLRDESRGNTCTDCWYNCRGEIESLYHPVGVLRSLPTFLFDRGRPPQPRPQRGAQGDAGASRTPGRPGGVQDGDGARGAHGEAAGGG
jgi:MoaA/NifB/PqqE/SkfB family radical SAM enzyme